VWESDALKGNTFLIAKYLKGEVSARTPADQDGIESQRGIDTNDTA
jgi:hypothetical protein